MNREDQNPRLPKVHEYRTLNHDHPIEPQSRPFVMIPARRIRGVAFVPSASLYV